jgi:hypothetical protein
MSFQLVLQWPASSLQDYDAMIEVENILRKRLASEHVVNGHDAGSGEVNIFIRTEDPQRAFEEIRSIIGGRDLWLEARAAYREVTGNAYTILWPSGLQTFKAA